MTSAVARAQRLQEEKELLKEELACCVEKVQRSLHLHSCVHLSPGVICVYADIDDIQTLCSLSGKKS